jgi:maltose O-acetyltransferase
MGLGLYAVNHLVAFFPPTRLYGLKARLYRLAGLDVHATAMITSSARIWGTGAVRVGRETFIGHEALILSGGADIRIGSGVDIAPRVLIVNGSHAVDGFSLRSAGEGISRPIVIEDGAWIGAGSVIIGGVTIGHKAVVGAGSVVVKDIPPRVVAVGSPCRPVKSL